MAVINQRVALGNIRDLTTPTEDAKYQLGSVVEVEGAKGFVSKYIYVKAHDDLTAYQPYLVLNSGAAGSEWITGAAITLAGAVALVGVPQVAFKDGYYGFVQIEGRCTVANGSGSVTAGNTAELKTAGTALISTTGSAPTINTCAVIAATTTGTTMSANLMGYRVEIRTT